MNPICPHCDAEQWHANSAWDSGEPECRPGSLCNECGQFVEDDDWLFPEDEESEAG